MEDVDMEDHGDNEDLKPLKEYGVLTHTKRLTEFAAVTPVDASAIRFAAIDIVDDITRQYRRAYDQALARSVFVRLGQALQGAGARSVQYDTTSGVESLVSLIEGWSTIAEATPNGVWLLTLGSTAHLTAQAVRAGVNGPLSTGRSTLTRRPSRVASRVG
jgi:hypothetical protein